MAPPSGEGNPTVAPRRTTDGQDAARVAASIAEALRIYKELLDQGILTQEEFQAKKKELLEQRK